MTQIRPRWPRGDDEMAAHIRAFDWAATPLGPTAEWSERLKVMVEQVLASPLVSSLVCGPERVLIYNDAAAKLYGDRHPAALGRPLPDTFPEGWATVAPFYERAFAGETVQVAGQPLDTRGEGQTTDVFDAVLTPVCEADGQVAYVHMIGFEFGERVRTEVALRKSEELRRIALESGGMGAWRWDTRSRLVRADDTFQSLWGISFFDALHPASAYTDLMYPEGAATLEAVMAKEIAPDEVFHDQVQIASGPNAGRWVQWRGRAERDRPWIINGVSFDITAQKLAEQRLRESEERFRAVAEQAEAGIVIVDVVHRMSFVNDRYCEILGRARDDLFGRSVEELTHPDDWVLNEPLYRRAMVEGTSFTIEKRYLRPDGSAVWVRNVVSALRDGTGIIIGGLAVSIDVSERRQAEAALRESEERFRQFAASSSDALWIRDAATLTMEYVSPASATIYGVPSGALLGDVKHWAALIAPDDRDTALRHLEQAQRGEAVVHEFRVQRPSDGSFRWIRDTAFALHDQQGRVQRIGGIAQDITDAKLSAEHSAVLLAELQHRVRNIMAVIRAITARTSERAKSVPDYAKAMAGRLLTLARVQALLTRAANVGVGLTGIVRDELNAQAQHDRQYTLDGPDLLLSPKAAEVLTLAIHELTTNALKWGGLSVPDGHVTVRWATFEKRETPWLGFDWTETGAPERPPPDPSVPRRRGFGSELIEGRIPYELGGRGTVVIEPGGARCHLEFPLRDGASILATDAPQRATVFGGALDMTGEADLSGRRVLVVEDDFYLATDAARALQGAGAEVVGPSPSEESARAELDEQRPDAAVVDINLGRGPSFKLAETLKDRGIPFVFVTGYDMEFIPAEFDGFERLQKPVQLRQIVAAVAKLVNKAA